jgi:hypothetical protein
VATVAPQTFLDLKNLVRIHLKQIFKLDQITEKVPTNAVVLLMMVAYEVLSVADDPTGDTGSLFATEHKTRYNVPVRVGLDIVDALLNGLAHTYDPYPILVQNLGEVRIELAWKGCSQFHFRGVLI